MNAMLMTEEEMRVNIAKDVKPQVEEFKINEIYYYGAGCLGDQVCGNVERALRKSIPAEKIEIASDLLASARALCGDKAGSACILGTGSNSCYYDGKEIKENVSPL